MRQYLLNSLSAAVVVLTFCNGCTVGYHHRMNPATHFTPPNSNVKPLGPVSVKLKGMVSWLGPPSWMTSDTDARVYNAALSQVDGADVIIDYVRTTTLRNWPGLQIYWTEEVLEGTAAKVVVGEQSLE